jgi:hypothetical protein
MVRVMKYMGANNNRSIQENSTKHINFVITSMLIVCHDRWRIHGENTDETSASGTGGHGFLQTTLPDRVACELALVPASDGRVQRGVGADRCGPGEARRS